MILGALATGFLVSCFWLRATGLYEVEVHAGQGNTCFWQEDDYCIFRIIIIYYI